MRKWIAITLVGTFIITGFFIKIYYTAAKPVKSAEKKAAAIARKEASMREVDEFRIFNGNETYYVIKGTDQRKEKVIVWVPEKKGAILVRKEKDGITKQEAVHLLLEEGKDRESSKIISVKWAVVKERPAWEIYYRSENNLISYYYVDFETGEWLKKIENL